MYQAIAKNVSQLSEPGICLSCTFFVNSTADGCAMRLENDQHTFVFNTFRRDDEDLALLECFPVPETGVFHVHVYEIQLGEIQEHTSRQLDNIVIIEKAESEYYHGGFQLCLSFLQIILYLMLLSKQ